MSIPALKQWFDELGEDFDSSEVPSPDKVDDVISKVFSYFGVTPVKYLGKGDNGIALLTSDGDIVKFTIDRSEAYLWHRLKSKPQSGITQLKDVINLKSSKTGNSIIYVLKAEYAPSPVTSKQARLISQAKDQALKDSQEQLTKLRQRGVFDKELYWKTRAGNLVKQFSMVADQDDSFRLIPDLIMDLADKVGGYIFDLQPDNFRLNVSGDVILVDPSVPELVGDIQNPQELLYEHLLVLCMNSNILLY
ncbi:MAG: hypothetical protein ACYSYU_00100 [Planctomycetota bacterium]|jgi:hypothetical protein